MRLLDLCMLDIPQIFSFSSTDPSLELTYLENYAEMLSTERQLHGTSFKMASPISSYKMYITWLEKMVRG